MTSKSENKEAAETRCRWFTVTSTQPDSLSSLQPAQMLHRHFHEETEREKAAYSINAIYLGARMRLDAARMWGRIFKSRYMIN